MLNKRDDVERVRSALALLCAPLHQAFESAWTDTLESLAGFGDRIRATPGSRGDFIWLRTHSIRARVIQRLEQSDLGLWKLAGSIKQNGQLMLTDGSYRLLALHSSDRIPVPPPGPNRARKVYYHNPPLAGLPDIWPPKDRLLLLWRHDENTGVPALRVVRPIGGWDLGARAKIDLDFWVPLTAEELLALQFVPSDRGIDLEIPDGREEGLDNAKDIPW